MLLLFDALDDVRAGPLLKLILDAEFNLEWSLPGENTLVPASE
jgi:hypothetical protein